MIIFTNEHRGLNRHYYQNSNRFRTFHVNTKEEAKAVIKDVETRGFKVTKITTNLGTPIHKHFVVHINDNTYHLLDYTRESLMDYLIRVCGHNPEDITIEEVSL